jgi:hypothetical protein
MRRKNPGLKTPSPREEGAGRDDLDTIKKAQDELMNVSHKRRKPVRQDRGGAGGPERRAARHRGRGCVFREEGRRCLDADFEEVKKYSGGCKARSRMERFRAFFYRP